MQVVKERESKGFRLALDLPDRPLKPQDQIPSLQLNLSMLELSGYQLGYNGLRDAITRIGTYQASCPQDFTENESWFTPGNIVRLVRGDYTDHGWYPYAFQVAPTTLRIDYYNAWEPKQCGMFELGKNFSRIYLDVTVPRQKMTTTLDFDGGVVSSIRPELFSALMRQTTIHWMLSVLRTEEQCTGWRGLFGKRYNYGICRAGCYLDDAEVDGVLYDVVMRLADYNPAHYNDRALTIKFNDEPAPSDQTTDAGQPVSDRPDSH